MRRLLIIVVVMLIIRFKQTYSNICRDVKKGNHYYEGHSFVPKFVNAERRQITVMFENDTTFTFAIVRKNPIRDVCTRGASFGALRGVDTRIHIIRIVIVLFGVVKSYLTGLHLGPVSKSPLTVTITV